MILDIIFQSGEVINQAPAKGFWDYLLMILPSLTGLATLYIAILLYKNQDANKVARKYQIDTVDLLEKALRKIKLEVYVWDSSTMSKPKTDTYDYDNILLMVERKEDMEWLKQRTVYFSNSVLFDLEFYNFKNENFLPDKIKSELQKFSDSGMIMRIPAKENELPKILVWDSKKGEEDYDKLYKTSKVEYENSVFQNLANYFTQIKKVKGSIDDWKSNTFKLK